jgi:hypothetical protein
MQLIHQHRIVFIPSRKYKFDEFEAATEDVQTALFEGHYREQGAVAAVLGFGKGVAVEGRLGFCEGGAGGGELE